MTALYLYKGAVQPSRTSSGNAIIRSKGAVQLSKFGTVPDVTGDAQATAEASLVSAGFVVGTVTTAISSVVPLGAVISQSLSGEQWLGESVDLVVSLGAPASGGSTSKPRKKRKRYVVEIDGQIIQVANITEAQAVLQQARDIANEAAQRDVDTPVTPKPPRVTVKTISGNKTTSKVLQQDIKRTQSAILRAYRKAADAIARDQEIAKRLAQQVLDDDEDDALTALLLS